MVLSTQMIKSTLNYLWHYFAWNIIHFIVLLNIKWWLGSGEFVVAVVLLYSFLFFNMESFCMWVRAVGPSCLGPERGNAEIRDYATPCPALHMPYSLPVCLHVWFGFCPTRLGLCDSGWLNSVTTLSPWFCFRLLRQRLQAYLPQPDSCSFQ